jgi:CHASE3 domain sensor protein
VDGPSRLRRRLRLLSSRTRQLVAAAVDEAPSALAGVATVVIAAVFVLLLGFGLSFAAALLL